MNTVEELRMGGSLRAVRSAPGPKGERGQEEKGHWVISMQMRVLGLAWWLEMLGGLQARGYTCRSLERSLLHCSRTADLNEPRLSMVLELCCKK